MTEIKTLAQIFGIATIRVWSLIRNHKVKSTSTKSGTYVDMYEFEEWANDNTEQMKEWRAAYELTQRSVYL